MLWQVAIVPTEHGVVLVRALMLLITSAEVAQRVLRLVVYVSATV